jgi:hypothetical protein
VEDRRRAERRPKSSNAESMKITDVMRIGLNLRFTGW